MKEFFSLEKNRIKILLVKNKQTKTMKIIYEAGSRSSQILELNRSLESLILAIYRLLCV